MLRINNRFFDYIYAFSLELTKFVKFSFIIGSKAAFFSLAQAISPTIGFFTNTLTVFFVFALRTLITIGFGKLAIFTSLFYHIPTFFASLYLTSDSKILKAIIPTTCILLFISHPIGNQAFIYSFYWLIPIAIAFIETKSIFTKALGSTFVAHAVGSIIWLYTHSLTPNMWNSLISIVWIERLLFALCMTLAFYLIQFLVNNKNNILNIIKINIAKNS